MRLEAQQIAATASPAPPRSPAARAARLPCAALFAPNWPPAAAANGIVTYVSNIVPAMRSLGANAQVLTSHMAEHNESEFVHGFTARPNLRMRVASRLWRNYEDREWFADELFNAANRLRKNVALDILEIEESFGWARRASRCKVPVVVRLHGPWFLNGAALGVTRDRKFLSRNHWERAGLARAAGVTAPSQDVLTRAREFFQLPLPGAAVIPNPCPAAPDSQRWSLDSSEPDVLLFVGRFDRHKGGDIVLDAFAKVRDRFPNATLLFVGPDTGIRCKDGSLCHFQDYLTRAVPDPAARKQVQYLGFRSAGETASLRRTARLTIVASRYETFSMTAVEALAVGSPLLATAAGGIPEIVQHERNGLLCNPDDAGTLAQSMIHLLENPQLAAALGAQAHADCRERYDPISIARQTLDYYSQVLGR